MDKLSALLNGKKTYLVLLAMFALNIFVNPDGLSGAMDVDTLHENLWLALVAAGRSALAKLEGK